MYIHMCNDLMLPVITDNSQHRSYRTGEWLERKKRF